MIDTYTFSQILPMLAVVGLDLAKSPQRSATTNWAILGYRDCQHRLRHYTIELDDDLIIVHHEMGYHKSWPLVPDQLPTTIKQIRDFLVC